MSDDSESKKHAKPYKVIETINPTTVVVNVGEMNGITSGKRCTISAPEHFVTDPSTHEELGVLQLLKGEGIVTQAYEKFSVVRSVKRPGRFALSSILDGEVKHAPFSELVEVGDTVQFE